MSICIVKRPWMMSTFASSMLALLLAIALPTRSQTTDDLWEKLAAGGYTLLIRHAQTEPGSGDPLNFQLDDCKTQRNLSDEGRAQARRLGEQFRARNVPIASVRASQYCRCLETARLAFADGVEPWEMLNSIFVTSVHNDARIAALKLAIRETSIAGNQVLVTHNVNIAAVTGISPAAAEVIIVRADGAGDFSVIGRIAPPY